MPVEFDAAVFTTPEAPLTIERVSLPDTPPPGEVLVRLKASGVCHSDFHALIGEWEVPAPMILGHEGAGIVESVGDGVTTLVEGDHVVLSWTPSCRRCRYCVGGRPVLCDMVSRHSANHLAFDGRTRVTSAGEQDVYSFAGLGTFGQYTLVPESAAIAIRDDAPFEQSALIGCAVTTGVGAVVNTAKVRPSDTVLVLGCGGVGLNAIQGARLVGARQIIAADISDQKLDQARVFGATDLVNSGRENLADRVHQLTGGRGVEVAVEAIGLPRTIESAYEVLARGGTAVVAGQVADGVRISIDPFVMSDQELSLIGSNYGSSKPDVDFPLLVDHYMHDRIDLDSLVTRVIDLTDINEAFDDMKRGIGIRSVIKY
ncbi:S-(hydroxymethyl)glutathione dehydrogenase / alcohol dehydrogenase [Amycolatopsis lurida]|uniref:Dehydrogenase n=1 Tax=Amycolatopsis lurida NRRL 2430 TaxID=1460371 RepID=A0A2P2FIU0_AMYLU|nr:Zn-dependent alcohol dehydrogenase [Amycolatopsis lurida]KFU76640.1 dehydrogenase [Amycolatopsis lurida NRRL 2430]SEE51656.1 S-(hydroxymethyl)glutathione dehydrogenase / alcohol dehydrogenase [Amycolatopsis lurida]